MPPAAKPDAPASTVTSDRYEFEERTLDNGLRVITLEDASCPIVAVQVWYHVGSKDEPEDRQGFAHMFEHMMFRGTDRLGPTDHFDLVRKTGGSSNAYTSFDNTTYVNVAPANQLELLLWLEAERMAALRIDEKGFETERRVVEEERRMGLNQPYGTVLEQVIARVFPGHPYRWSPIGNIPHLRRATIDELQSFWDRFYVPVNATLVMVGAFESNAAHELAARHFGWIPRCDEPPRVARPTDLGRGTVEIRLREKKGPVPVVGVGYRVPPLGHADGPALEVLAHILGAGESSRLYRALVTRRVAAMASAGLLQLEHAGLLGAGAALLPFGRTKKAIAALDVEIERLRAEGVSERELEKAKNVLYKSQVESRLGIESKAEALGRAATLLDSTEDVNRAIERFRAVTVEEVRRVAVEYLVPGRRIVLRVKPSLLGLLGAFLRRGATRNEGDDETAAGDVPTDLEAGGRRAVPGGPKAGVERPRDLPATAPFAAPLDSMPPIHCEERTLANGLRIFVVSNHEVPFVAMRLGLRHGASEESPGRPGTAALALAMLTQGTERRDAATLAEDLETHAIDLGGSAGHDSASVGASTLSEHVERALESLAEVVRMPAFPERELETRIRRAKSGKLVEEKEPGEIAARQLDRLLYGSHPYSRPADGRAADLDRLRTTDLRAWWREFAVPGECGLLFSGDITSERAFALAERAFADWKGDTGSKAVPELPPLPARTPTRVVIVDQRGSGQSQIRIGQLAELQHSSPDYPTASVLNQVFGGSFGARLNSVVRVEKGLTYGIRGGFQVSRRAAEFEIATFTKTDKTAEAVRVILDEIRRLQTDAPTAEEMDFARSFLTGSAARRRETPQAIADEIWATETLGLPRDFFERHLERVARSTSEEVLEFARRHIDPDALTIVVVGDAALIESELAAVAPVSIVRVGE